MLMSIRGLVAASLLAGCGLAATPALAQGNDEVWISGNASVVSEYRFRGVDLSGGDIAIQGGVDVNHSSGFYIGVWGSSLDEDTLGFGHTEVDIYGGWSGEIASGIKADVGVTYYAYPNAPAGDFDYVEFYGSLGATLGPAEATLGMAYAPEQDSLGSDDNIYFYLDLGVGIPNTPITLSGHVGYTDGFLALTNNRKAFDWSLGASYAINKNLSLGVSYVEAEGDYAPGDYDFTDGAVVGTLTVSF